MLRAALLGLLTLSAVSCKSHDESQATSQSGVAAGKVIDVTGTVTLHHGTEARPLAKGAMVDADDEVETGADGSVVIEVQHNNVNWELGANKKGKMRESLAWTQPKKDKSAKAVDQDSAAAGRHAERNAAESSANAAPAEMERADEAEKEEAAPAPAAAAAPAPAAAPETAKKAAAPAPKPRAAATAAAPPPAPPVAQPMAPSASAAPGGAHETAPAPPPPPPPPPKIIAKTAAPSPTPRAMAPSSDANADRGGLGLTGAGEGGGGTGGGGGLGSIGTVGKGAGGGGGTASAQGAAATSSPDAAHLVFAKRPDLRKCVKSVKTLRIKIEIDDAGKATLIFVDKANATDQSCVKKVIDGIKFPATKTTITTELVKA